MTPRAEQEYGSAEFQVPFEELACGDRTRHDVVWTGIGHHASGGVERQSFHTEPPQHDAGRGRERKPVQRGAGLEIYALSTGWASHRMTVGRLQTAGWAREHKSRRDAVADEAAKEHGLGAGVESNVIVLRVAAYRPHGETTRHQQRRTRRRHAGGLTSLARYASGVARK